MLIASILINFLGIVVFLFIFWKRLREDYSSEIIFKTAFNILIGILIGFLIFLKFPLIGFFWPVFIGSLMGFSFSLFRFKIKFFETFEAFTIALFPWIGFTFLLDSVIHSSLNSFFAFIAILIFVFIAYYLDTHYKNFTWYKSGKVGFAGIVTLSIFFVIRSTLAIFEIHMISFVDLKIEAVISAAAAFICFILLFNLARIKE